MLKPLDYRQIGEPAENCRVVVISPRLANEWLARNVSNRPLNPRTVNKLANTMEAGEWVLNGETIVFSADGRLIQGQHRLSACVQSNCSFASFVVFAVASPTAFATFDCGRARKASDALHIDGNTNCTRVAGLASKLIAWRLGLSLRGVHGTSRADVTNARIVEFVRRTPGLADAVQASSSVDIANCGATAFCYYLFHRIDADRCKAFFRQLATGELLSIGSPVLTLRNLLIKSGKEASTVASRSVRADKLSLTDQVAYIIKAWNAYYHDRELRLLRFAAGESFPVPIGDTLWGCDKAGKE